MNVKYSEDVLRAKESNEPVLALESTIIAHGMPFPENLTFGKKAESLCRDNGVVPATIAVIDGVPQVGLDQKQLERIAQSENIKKIPRNMLGVSAAQGLSGATTVSSTAHIAHPFRAYTQDDGTALSRPISKSAVCSRVPRAATHRQTWEYDDYTDDRQAPHLLGYAKHLLPVAIVPHLFAVT